MQYESVVKLRKNIPPTVNYHELQRRMKTDNSEEES